jgi:hypothetical protein
MIQHYGIYRRGGSDAAINGRPAAAARLRRARFHLALCRSSLKTMRSACQRENIRFALIFARAAPAPAVAVAGWILLLATRGPADGHTSFTGPRRRKIFLYEIREQAADDQRCNGTAMRCTRVKCIIAETDELAKKIRGSMTRA